MNKIIKFKFFFCLLLISTLSNANTNLPFDNIYISSEPKKYDNILFEDFHGKIVNLEHQKSKIYMLNFWATWCLPCKEEMPYLDKLQNVDGIKIFPINIEKKNKYKSEIFFKNLEIKNLSIYFDTDSKLANLFYLRGIPTTIILNKDKKEIARILGAADFSDQKFIDWINNVSN